MYNRFVKTIYFSTGNPEKIRIAQAACAATDIVVEPVVLDIDEIQGEDSELIILDKVRRAFEKFGKAIVVSDDAWDIVALKGFPGPYMKSINHWFTPQDFLRLMDGIKERRVIIRQYLAYTDGGLTKVFKNDIHGQIIHEVRGKNIKSPNTTVIVLDPDNGKTIAEVFEQGIEAVTARYKSQPDVWHKFIEWYKNI